MEANQLTAEELAEIRERASKATPGPWVSGYYVFGGLVRKGQDQCNWCGKNAPLVSTYEAQPNEAQAAEFDSTAHQHLFPRDDEDAWREILSLTTYTSISGNYDYEAGGICSTNDDAAFIAAARTDIPRLLATVEALRAALSEIAEGSGPFAEDRLTHAINVIEKSKRIAREALAGTWRPEE